MGSVPDFLKLLFFTKIYIDTIIEEKICLGCCDPDVRFWKQLIEPLGIAVVPFLMAFLLPEQYPDVS